jgi:hypothetical protein
MYKMKRKVMIQKTVFIRNKSRITIIFPSTIQKFCLEILMQKWGERIFSNRQLGMSLHYSSNENGVRMVTFATSKNLVKSTVFLHRNIHKYTWTLLMGRLNQIDNILIDRSWHSSILEVRSFDGAGRDTDHCLEVAKVRESLVLSKQAAQRFGGEIISGS